MVFYEKHLFICTNQKETGKKCCENSNAHENWSFLKRRIQELGLAGPGKVRVSRAGCLGRCIDGPCIVIYPEQTWYTYRSFSDIERIIQKHILLGELVEELLLT